MKTAITLLIMCLATMALNAQTCFRGDNGKYGYQDGRYELLPAIYDDARDFSERLGAVKLNRKWGFIDRTGKEIIPFKYDAVLSFSTNGLATVKLDYKWGCIDKTGKEIIPLKYGDLVLFSKEGLAKVQLNGKWGFIDKTENEIIPLKYDYLGDFSKEE